MVDPAGATITDGKSATIQVLQTQNFQQEINLVTTVKRFSEDDIVKHSFTFTVCGGEKISLSSSISEDNKVYQKLSTQQSKDPFVVPRDEILSWFELKLEGASA